MNFAVALIPKSRIGKVLATVWLMSCVAVLVFGFVQRDIHDMPIAFTWFLFFLSFPIGSVAVAVIGYLTGAVTLEFGLNYYPFWNELPMWVTGVIVGYLQWFVVVPLIARGFKRLAAWSGRLP
jgi:hypothetical protein